MNFMVIHQGMLRDEERIRQFRRAIRKAVRSGDRVLDLGAGTGIMGFLALQTGAGMVYAIEKSPVIHAATHLARSNGWEDRFHAVRGPSLEVRLKQKADILVTETIGHFGLDEGILKFVADANRRLMKRGARVVPEEVTLMVRAVSLDSGYRDWVAWAKPVGGIEYRSLRELAIHAVWPLGHWPRRHLSPAKRLVSFALRGLKEDPLPVETNCRIRFDRGGVFHGTTGWFRARLAPGVLLDSSKTSSWKPFFFPSDRPLRVRKGEEVLFTIRIEPDQEYTWRYELLKGGKVAHASEHSTFFLHEDAMALKNSLRG